MEPVLSVFLNEFSEFENLFVGNEYISKKIAKNNLLCDESEFGDKQFYLKKGLVQTIAIDEDGNEYVLQQSPKGSIVPLILNEPKHFVFSNTILLRAADDCEVICFTAESLKSLVLSNSNFGLKCLEHKCTENNLYLYRIIGFSLWNSRKRVCNVILDLSRLKGDVIHISQLELAEDMGISLMQLNRVLRDLREQGVIETHRNKICIKNREKLIDFSLGK
jgi:CRP-like cAMP-binding protein